LEGIASVWIGGFQLLGSPESDEGWEWVTGEMWSYTNWDDDEPNNNDPRFENERFLEIRGVNGRWNDLPLVLTEGIPPTHFVVEFETTSAPVPEPDTLLLLGTSLASFLGCGWCRKKQRM
jgi:hypothetical protein